MQLTVLGPNRTEVRIGDLTVFFSYSTPVAAYVPALGWVRTAEKFSVTTSRHINQWLDGVPALTLPAAQFKAAIGLDSLKDAINLSVLR